LIRHHDLMRVRLGARLGRSRRMIGIRAGQALSVLFLIGPISDLADASLSPGRRAAIGAGLVAFVVVYLSLLPPAPPLLRRGPRAIVAGLGVLVLLETLLLALGAPNSFWALTFYVVAAAAILLPTHYAVAVLGAGVLFVSVDQLLRGASASTIFAYLLSLVAIGVMMVAFGSKTRANRQLEAARHELAGLAVTEERLRIARDLHDLLGHSLSVVALKAELADRLVAADPERAHAELEDVQRVTRQALSDVRAAVQGYRQLALTEAVGSAKAALAAAGIDCRVETTEPELPADVESVLAWAVREGTTNVVRHSNARTCAISLHADGDRVELAIDDDGDARGAEGAGSGLAGLAERATRLAGTLEAGAKPGGGFRLRLAMPLGAS
jgi:two-component system, NarL family, sensor histidine kinase DesK